jgi:hypothetical protein
MNGQYIMGTSEKKYKYPITDEKRLATKLYMRAYRKNRRRDEMALLLDVELAVGGKASPPGYDTTAEPNLFVATLQQPDSIGASGSNCDSDTSGRQQNIYSID